MNRVSKALTPAFLIAAAAATAIAQDSVSNVPSPQPQGAGDAFSPYATDQTCARYVVDLTPFTSSWGTAYAGAPLIKSNKLQAEFSNSFLSGNAISRLYATEHLTGSYKHWTAPGQGVHPTNNNAASNITVDALTKQFGVVFSDYAGSINAIVSGVVNLDPANPGRLYVSRYNAAINGQNSSGNTAQFGVGTVDEYGVVSFRAETPGSGANNILGHNLLTISSMDRTCGSLNQIMNDPAQSGTTNGTDPAATTVYMENRSNNITVPNIFPAQYNGSSTPLTTGFDFNYYNGSTITPFANTNSRGALSFSATPLRGLGAASVGVLVKPDNANTRGFQIADIDENANVVGTWQVYNADTPAVLAQWGGFQNELAGDWEFGHYRGSTAYRGGVSQLAMGTDKDGNAIMAAFVSAYGTNGISPVGAIVAMRDADGIANGNEQWTLVARNSMPFSRATPVLDGPGGNTIGYLSNVYDYPAFSQTGPSLSAPAIDAMGNIWFTAPVEFVDSPDQFFDPSNIDMAVLRAVYNPATFTYELEAVLSSRTILAGLNSGTDYMINLITLPSNNGIASSAMFSSAVMAATYADVDRTALEPASNLSTGGVVVALSIIYDANGDGFFDYNSDDAGNDDERYQVLYFISPDAEPIIIAPTCPCAADLNGDCVVNADDLGVLLSAFGCTGATCQGDFNGDGVVNADDLGVLLSSFGCTN